VKRDGKTQIALVIAASILAPILSAYIHSLELSKSDLLSSILNFENPDRDSVVAQSFKDSSYSFSRLPSMDSRVAILRC
jgi:hypothetical protein